MKVCVSHVRHQRILWNQKHAWVISSRSTYGFLCKATHVHDMDWLSTQRQQKKPQENKSMCGLHGSPNEKSCMSISTNKAQYMRYQRALNNAQRDSIAAHNRNCTHGQTDRKKYYARDSMYSVCLTCCHSYKRACFVFDFRYHFVVFVCVNL